GVVVLTGGFALLLFVGLSLLALGSQSLCFHEFGVSQPAKKGRPRCELRYQDIGELTWTGSVTMTLRAVTGVDVPPIQFSILMQRPDADLLAMRDHISRAIAYRWLAKLENEPVRWTSRLRFLPGGLEYTPRALLLAEEPVTVPYRATSYRLKDKQMLLC